MHDERGGPNDKKMISSSIRQQQRPSSASRPRRYVQDTAVVSSNRTSDNKISSSSSRINKEPSKASSTITADVNNLVEENKALQAERATIEKYKKMYESILDDPNNAFLFEDSSIVDSGVVGGGDGVGMSSSNSGGKSNNNSGVLDVNELIEGLKLENILRQDHDDNDDTTASPSNDVNSVLSEIKASERRQVMNASSSSRRRQQNDGAEGEEQYQQVRKPRRKSRGGLDSSLKSQQSKDDDQRQHQRQRGDGYNGRPRSNSYKSGNGITNEGGSQRSLQDHSSSSSSSSHNQQQQHQRKSNGRPRSNSIKGSSSSKRNSTSLIDHHDNNNDSVDEQRITTITATRRKSGSSRAGGLSNSLRSSNTSSRSISSSAVVGLLDGSNRSDDSAANDIRVITPSSSQSRQCSRPRSNSKSNIDSSSRSDYSHDGQAAPPSVRQQRRRSSRRQSYDTNLSSNSRSSSPPSRRRGSTKYEDEKDSLSVTSNTSMGSRVGQFFGRFSFSSNAADNRSMVDDDDSDYYDNDVEDDIVPALKNSNALYKNKEKKGLFRKMKKFGTKIASKAQVLTSSSPSYKKYKVGDVVRYNIGKIRDSLESFDPQDPTVEVVIVAVHIDAVLNFPYYTIQLPDGSRKQTNMENLIDLRDYNNGTRPYARIKVKSGGSGSRSSSRNRRSSRREEEEGDDDDESSVGSARSTRSNRSTRSSSSRHRSDYNESFGDDDRSVKSSSSSRNGRSSGSRRPRVNSMRGGGAAVPEKNMELKRANHKSSKSNNGNASDDDDEEPVIIKLTTRDSAGSSFALDAAVAAAVGVRRASGHSSSHSCCGVSTTSNNSNSCNQSYTSLPVLQASSSSALSTNYERSCSGTTASSSFPSTNNKSYSSLPVDKRSKRSKPPVVVGVPSKKSTDTPTLSPTKKSTNAKSPQSQYNANKPSNSVNAMTPKKKSKSFVELSATNKKSKPKPPTIVELSSTKKSKPQGRDGNSAIVNKSKPPTIVETSPRKIRHANTVDETAARRSRDSASEQRRCRSTGPPKKIYPKGTCAKCDGCHLSENCTVYLKEREKHKDSWRVNSDSSQKQMGEDGGNKRVKATRVKQPADGSCLFHSLVYCFNTIREEKRTMNSSCASVVSSSSSVASVMPPPLTANYLRRKIANFISANPNLDIADDPLREWVLWDSGQSVKQYAASMAVEGWGGGIEIASCSQLYKVNIHVYEADPTKTNEYVRISCFNVDRAKQTLHILYHGRNHYDALHLK